MVRLSVNINKVATLRNARGGNLPDVQQFATDCERFGAEGITIHPRPDQRHITYTDVGLLRPLITTEFNIEGNPTEDFIQLVLNNKPEQVTLVPDDPDQLTSDHGWDTVKHASFLKDVIQRFQVEGIRVSIFVDPDPRMVTHAAETGTDRVELYTESYASLFPADREKAIVPFIEAAKEAQRVALGLNAGHDLNLQNLSYFAAHIPDLLEVSIGHALISDALYYGIENTIQLYRRQLLIQAV
ncbi:MAG: pyridoxine 5'-phosphate synthase [Bacteroidales bacterium]|nr:pyridoxine 5'-phosphate synthase [Bacteroidales bacterium]MDD3702437.1 pyridoxine 5'-phosphate synthase [Bacteroidales bacterium]MDY0370499.1 pyridoxine 5'-phosphate synthase [Bacteroidales bacterium]